MAHSYLAIIWISCDKELTQQHFNVTGIVILHCAFLIHIIWVINIPWLVVSLIYGIKMFNSIAIMMGSHRVTPYERLKENVLIKYM
jgi:hypothetical protein